MLTTAKKKIFLCDSSKFGKVAQYKQCSLNALDSMISEDETAFVYKDKFPQIELL